MALLTHPLDALQAQRGLLFPWVPVMMALGIGWYFALPTEPGLLQYMVAAAVVLCLTAAVWFGPERAAPVVTATALIAAGFLIAGARAHLVADPVLGFRYYGAVQGRVVNIDRSGSDKLRLTLDRVVLERMDPARTPARVRLSLHGTQGFITPEPGMVVILTGHLSPPDGPVEPGGFDFQRMAWFDGLGAVGYTRKPVLMLDPPDGGAQLWLNRLRLRISTAVQTRIAGEPGAFAAAILTGDRSGMSLATQDSLRASNLAHLLAISGLHMGLLTGTVFTALRLILSLWPALALRLAVKKLAAAGALSAGAFYLALSGGNVATERAFVMVGVMLLAVMVDRRAITLRAVALAAVIVLVLWPESLGEPGFQMSFSATVALVAVFGWLRGWEGRRLPKWLAPVAMVVISSAVAGIATAPYAAAHFNRIADYGLIANLLSVPLMGIWVMPAAVLAAALSPFGLAWIGLALMEPPIRWILGVAAHVSDMDGALTHVPAPPDLTLPILSLGALWLIVWRGRRWVRLLGVAPMVLAFTLWAGAERPALLVSGDGGLMGVMTDQGRALSKPRGQGFAAQNWLENDGDRAEQKFAANRPGIVGTDGEALVAVADLQVRLLSGRGVQDRVAAACAKGGLVVLAARLDGAVPHGCQIMDQDALAATGPLALFDRKGVAKIVTTAQISGNRLWNSRRPKVSATRLQTASAGD